MNIYSIATKLPKMQSEISTYTVSLENTKKNFDVYLHEIIKKLICLMTDKITGGSH